MMDECANVKRRMEGLPLLRWEGEGETQAPIHVPDPARICLLFLVRKVRERNRLRVDDS